MRIIKETSCLLIWTRKPLKMGYAINPFLDQITILGYYANSADLVQMPPNATSDQSQHCLLTDDGKCSENGNNH